VVFILLLPITYLVLRFSKPVPQGEVAATYGIPQKPKPGPKVEVTTAGGEEKTQEEEPEKPGTEEPVEDKQLQDEESQEKIES
jgi:phosphatidylglycerol:prolipoprotein diacylglycerol transferase